MPFIALGLADIVSLALGSESVHSWIKRAEWLLISGMVREQDAAA